MAVEYEQYQKSAEANRAQMILEARARLERNLKIGPKLVELPGFFRDVYLLSKVDKLDEKPDLMTKIRQVAGHPRIRVEFVNTIKAQDAAGESQEMLAYLHVGKVFDYSAEEPFKVVFDKLEAKHQQLIADAEKKRKEEAAARRRAKTEWPPPEPTIGKSPEWIEAQDKIAILWGEKSRSLPKGLDRQTETADKDYFSAGFSLLQEQILSGTPAKAIRAMLEYLIPHIWRQPRMVEPYLKDLTNGTSRPTNLREVNIGPKTFFIPPDLQDLTNPPNRDQTRRIRKPYRIYSHALHPDTKYPDTDINLKTHIETIHKAINSAWSQVDPLLSK